MPNRRIARVGQALILCGGGLSVVVAFALKHYIIQHQDHWARDDLVRIPLFGWNLLAPTPVAYAYFISCLLPFLLIPALALFRQRHTPRR